jgi:hypothetical protein
LQWDLGCATFECNKRCMLNFKFKCMRAILDQVSSGDPARIVFHDRVLKCCSKSQRPIEAWPQGTYVGQRHMSCNRIGQCSQKSLPKKRVGAGTTQKLYRLASGSTSQSGPNPQWHCKQAPVASSHRIVERTKHCQCGLQNTA